jgi:hypothetical protein
VLEEPTGTDEIGGSKSMSVDIRVDIEKGGPIRPA